jgi:hypothetical protein
MVKIDSIPAIDSIIVHKTIVVDTVYNATENKLPVNSVIENIDAKGIPFLIITGLFITAAILFVLFKMIDKYLSPILESSKAIKKGKLFIFRIKCIVWFLFAVFAFYQIIVANLIIGIVLTLFIVAVGLNFWKDFLVGLFYKIEGKLVIGDYITVSDIKGKIIKFNKRNIEIAAENESILFIPFRQLIDSPISKKSDKGDIRSRKINITTTNEGIGVNEIEALLQQCPWIYAHRPNTVTKLEKNQFEVRVFGTNNFTYNKIEAYLNDNL